MLARPTRSIRFSCLTGASTAHAGARPLTEEMRLPGFVYFSDLKAFAEKVAAFHGQPVNSLCDTLEALIGEARAILGVEDALR